MFVGCRASSLSMEAKTAHTWRTNRHCIIARYHNITLSSSSSSLIHYLSKLMMSRTLRFNNQSQIISLLYRFEDFSIDEFRLARLKAGGLVLLLPENIATMTREQREVIEHPAKCFQFFRMRNSRLNVFVLSNYRK